MSTSIKTLNTVELFQGIWKHLSYRRRIQLGSLLIVMLFSGVSELLSLGAVIPFLSILTNPEQLWDQSTVKFFATSWGYTEANQLIAPAAFVFAAATSTAAIIRLTNLRLNGCLAAALGSDLSCEAYRRTLYQPYETHIKEIVQP